MGELFFEKDLFMEIALQAEEELRQRELQQEKEKQELQAFIDSLPRWESVPHQTLRSNHKDDPKLLRKHEHIQDLYDECLEYDYTLECAFGDMYLYDRELARTRICEQLVNYGYIKIHAYWLYGKLKGYKYTLEECRSEVWLQVAEMLSDPKDYDLPFVYRLTHKVQCNAYPDIMKYISHDKRFINHDYKVMMLSLEEMAGRGKEPVDRKTIALHDRIIEKVNIQEQNKQACDVLAQQGFSELEVQMVKLQQANPIITTREVADKLQISQSKASRTMRKIKEKLTA